MRPIFLRTLVPLLSLPFLLQGTRAASVVIEDNSQIFNIGNYQNLTDSSSPPSLTVANDISAYGGATKYDSTASIGDLHTIASVVTPNGDGVANGVDRWFDTLHLFPDPAHPNDLIEVRETLRLFDILSASGPAASANVQAQWIVILGDFRITDDAASGVGHILYPSQDTPQTLTFLDDRTLQIDAWVGPGNYGLAGFLFTGANAPFRSPDSAAYADTRSTFDLEILTAGATYTTDSGVRFDEATAVPESTTGIPIALTTLFELVRRRRASKS